MIKANRAVVSVKASIQRNAKIHFSLKSSDSSLLVRYSHHCSSAELNWATKSSQAREKNWFIVSEKPLIFHFYDQFAIQLVRKLA